MQAETPVWQKGRPSRSFSSSPQARSGLVLVGGGVATRASARRAAALSEVRVTTQAGLYHQRTASPRVPAAPVFGRLGGARRQAARAPSRRARRLDARVGARRVPSDVQAQRLARLAAPTTARARAGAPCGRVPLWRAGRRAGLGGERPLGGGAVALRENLSPAAALLANAQHLSLTGSVAAAGKAL